LKGVIFKLNENLDNSETKEKNKESISINSVSTNSHKFIKKENKKENKKDNLSVSSSNTNSNKAVQKENIKDSSPSVTGNNANGNKAVQRGNLHHGGRNVRGVRPVRSNQSGDNQVRRNQNSNQQGNQNFVHGERGRKHLKKRKPCPYCVDKSNKIDYKEIMRLRKYISERAKILPRRMTGMCARHQRFLNVAIKRARFLALLPCTGV